MEDQRVLMSDGVLNRWISITQEDPNVEARKIGMFVFSKIATNSKSAELRFSCQFLTLTALGKFRQKAVDNGVIPAIVSCLSIPDTYTQSLCISAMGQMAEVRKCYFMLLKWSKGAQLFDRTKYHLYARGKCYFGSHWCTGLQG